VVDPAIALRVVDVQPVAQGVGERASTVQRLLAGIVGAVAQADMVLDFTAEGFFRDHVDHRAGGTFAIQHRGRAAEHVDAFHRPVVHRERYGACAAVHANPVIQLHHRTLAHKAPGRVRRTAVARCAGVADACGTGHGVLHTAVTTGTDLRTGQAFDAGRCLEAVEVQARTGTGGGLEVDAFTIDFRGGNTRGWQYQGRGTVIGLGAVHRQQAEAGKKVRVHRGSESLISRGVPAASWRRVMELKLLCYTVTLISGVILAFNYSNGSGMRLSDASCAL